jgi:hypothetical protein
MLHQNADFINVMVFRNGYRRLHRFCYHFALQKAVISGHCSNNASRRLQRNIGGYVKGYERPGDVINFVGFSHEECGNPIDWKSYILRTYARSGAKVNVLRVELMLKPVRERNAETLHMTCVTFDLDYT